MEEHLIWIVAGFALVIIELMTGTFYLLVLGIGAFAGGLVAWLGAPFLAEVAAAGAVASIGTWLVQRWHKLQKRNADPGTNQLDLGQPVNFEQWVSQPDGMARVRYRGSTWEAKLAPDAGLRRNDVLYIVGQEGQTLRVSPTRV